MFLGYMENYIFLLIINKTYVLEYFCKENCI